jgi:hypothetical protein
MNKLLLTFLLILFPVSIYAQQAFSSLEEQMSSKEFEQTGLGKLSPDELEALNNYIRSRSLVALDKAKPVASSGSATTKTSASGGDGDERGLEVKKEGKKDRLPISSRLVGTFKGWDGYTTFTLENGMVWQQADKDKFYTKAMSNPMITIKSGALKTWRLSVEGHSSRCKVKRIQ